MFIRIVLWSIMGIGLILLFFFLGMFIEHQALGQTKQMWVSLAQFFATAIVMALTSVILDLYFRDR